MNEIKKQTGVDTIGFSVSMPDNAVHKINDIVINHYALQHELAIAMNALHDIAYVGSPSSHWLSGDNARARAALKELDND